MRARVRQKAERDRPRTAVGGRVRRRDSVEKLTGEVRYSSDLEVDDMLYAAVCRSNVPHGTLHSVDLDDARSYPGVAKAVGRSDLLGPFDDRVRHYGDVIAAVAADDAASAAAAVRAIDYDIEPLDAVHDLEKATVTDAPLVHGNNPKFSQPIRHDLANEHPRHSRNVDDYHRREVGDVQAGFAAADVIHEDTYLSPRVNHCNLETHNCIAEWEGDTLIVTETIGNVTHAEHQLGGWIGEENDIEIRMPPAAGSSFGGRSLAKLSLEPVAGTLARETGRPVKLWFDRGEEFTAADSRHVTRYLIRAGITSDGQLMALDLDVVTDTGPYPNGVGHIVLSNSRDRPLELYKLDNFRFEGVSVFTNNTPAGEYRGIGVTQLTWALESHLDELARKAGLDPVDLRERNLVETGYERPVDGRPIESCGVRECLERGLDRFEAVKRGHPNHEGSLRGWGMAAGVHTTGAGAAGNTDSSEARISLRPDGSVRVATAAVEMGQGSSTVLAQIVAQEVGLPVERIRVDRFRRDEGLSDPYGSVASRSTYIIGAAVQDAAQRLAATLRAQVTDELGVAEETIEIEQGVASGSGVSIDIEDVVNEEIHVRGRAETAVSPPSYGVHIAEVEVDPSTGQVDLVTYVAAQDIGFAVNPSMVEAQLEGAVLHGIEFALNSELRLSDGFPENANLADYPAISPWEMPDTLVCELIEAHEPSGPYGAKGVGTPAMPPIAPAIHNALRDATGHRFTNAPVGAETIYRALQTGGGREGVV